VFKQVSTLPPLYEDEPLKLGPDTGARPPVSYKRTDATDMGKQTLGNYQYHLLYAEMELYFGTVRVACSRWTTLVQYISSACNYIF
jgi:hypothetical protein